MRKKPATRPSSQHYRLLKRERCIGALLVAFSEARIADNKHRIDTHECGLKFDHLVHCSPKGSPGFTGKSGHQLDTNFHARLFEQLGRLATIVAAMAAMCLAEHLIIQRLNAQLNDPHTMVVQELYSLSINTVGTGGEANRTEISQVKPGTNGPKHGPLPFFRQTGEAAAIESELDIGVSLSIAEPLPDTLVYITLEVGRREHLPGDLLLITKQTSSRRAAVAARCSASFFDPAVPWPSTRPRKTTETRKLF